MDGGDRMTGDAGLSNREYSTAGHRECRRHGQLDTILREGRYPPGYP